MAKQRGLSGAVSASKAASERSLKVVVVERATREESYRSKTVLDWTCTERRSCLLTLKQSI